MHGDSLLHYGLQPFSAASPFHIEAFALLRVVQVAVSLRLNSCTFYTDSRQLALSIQNRTSLHHADWRAYNEIVQLATILAHNRHYRCIFIHREENTQAHQLATLARQSCFQYVGYTYPLFPA
ncbi:hypothetical protein FCM35_KLT16757 [Carex littledalei]|uniref:RNase H type-1 domain-containing protein n=1 Tax=Carex littledalei TaxID=544730 RepID=A0A833RHR0_9POAL|nr:hypothetical protein FCM35_KLT16757 [Carex littledalei]